jgi:chromate reductase
VIGATPGAIGTAAGQNSLKALLTVVDTILMGQPEVYFTYKPELFDENNNVVPGETKDFLNAWIDRFANWIERTGTSKTEAKAA